MVDNACPLRRNGMYPPPISSSIRPRTGPDELLGLHEFTPTRTQHAWLLVRRNQELLPVMTRRTARLLATALTILVAFLGSHSLASADAVQVQLPANLQQPTVDGANDWSCKPSETHPRPVVLVHGTGMNSTAWTILAPQLRDAGYCVFALNYGAVPRLLDPNAVVWGAGDITLSSKELARFVQSVRDATGAAQVDLVGHSQGGMLARQYMKFDGGADPVDPSRNAVRSVVALGATNHGTSFGGLQEMSAQLESYGLPGRLIAPFWMGPAGAQQLIGSPILASLNAGSEVEPGVDYTIIASRVDSVSTPPDGAFLTNDGTAVVRNQWIQDLCPSAQTSHDGLIRDPLPLYMVKAALDPSFSESNPAPC